MRARPSVVALTVCAVLTLGCGATERSPAPGSASPEPAPLVIPPLPVAAPPAPRTRPAEPEEPDGAPTTLAVPARDPRIGTHRPRSRALVLTEAQGLDRLIETTSTSSPDRPHLLVRAADAYGELAFTSSGKEAVRAREAAIRHYTTLIADHPSSPRLDEAYYYRGLSHELNGNKKGARTDFYELIAKTPKSPLVPLAYFAFGEMFFAEAMGDPSKNDLAFQAYQEVLRYPQAPVVPDALLRLGEVSLQRSDGAKAMEYFKKLKREHPDSDAAKKAP